MFMVTKTDNKQAGLERLYKRVKLMYGEIPPQIEFLASIDIAYVEMFLENVTRVIKHPHIPIDLFSFIRLHVAYNEGYCYCKAFNTKLLLQRGYTQEQLDHAIADIATAPFESKEQALAKKAIEAIYDQEKFTQGSIEELYEQGWSQKDLFDAVDHAGTLLKNGRILDAYLVQELS